MGWGGWLNVPQCAFFPFNFTGKVLDQRLLWTYRSETLAEYPAIGMGGGN